MASLSLAKPRWQITRRTRRALNFYAFISPWLIGFILLTLVPVGVGVWLSFTNYDGLNVNNIKWVGTAWYERFPRDRQAVESLKLVFIWTALNTPTWLVLSFVLAFIMSKVTRYRGFFRTMWYLPSVIPVVAVAWTWRTPLNDNCGLINQMVNTIRSGTVIHYMIYAFQQIFQRQRFGYGVPLIWILFAIIIVITIVLFGSRRYWFWTEKK